MDELEMRLTQNILHSGSPEALEVAKQEQKNTKTCFHFTTQKSTRNPWPTSFRGILTKLLEPEQGWYIPKTTLYFRLLSARTDYACVCPMTPIQHVTNVRRLEAKVKVCVNPSWGENWKIHTAPNFKAQKRGEELYTRCFGTLLTAWSRLFEEHFQFGFHSPNINRFCTTSKSCSSINELG